MKAKLFYPTQKEVVKERYRKLLTGITQASRIFSVNPKPFIHYRVAENVFCKCFSAKNVSRKDRSVDAVKEKYGIGIKTFLSNGIRKYEKIAEFDDRTKYPFEYGDTDKLIRQVAYYRNERINSTVKAFQLGNCLFHYLVRDIGKIHICECPMLLIEERAIVLDKSQYRRHIIKFRDNNFLYHFHLTKHTLYQAFQVDRPFETIRIPPEVNYDLLSEAIKELTGAEKKPEETLLDTKEYVVLPLYSTLTGEVPERSGLNQWNAGGRPRHYDEVYIPIPSIVHKKKPKFFPPRYQKFILKTPDGKEFSAAVCQANNKALMTDPNKDLGKWLLRKALGLRRGELATYEYLRKKNADTVIIYKISEGVYQVGLHSFGGFKKEYER